jgi:hypothetical protein
MYSDGRSFIARSHLVALLCLGFLLFLTVPNGVFGGGGPDIPVEFGEKEIGDQVFTVAGFTIGKATLADVQKRLGSAQFLPRKESSPYVIGYLFEDQNMAVLFEAGALGGWERLTGISLVSRGRLKPNIPLSKVGKSGGSTISTESGLRLGMGKDEIISALGRPSQIFTDRLVYKHVLRQEANTPKGPIEIDLTEWIEIFLFDSNVREIRFWRYKST